MLAVVMLGCSDPGAALPPNQDDLEQIVLEYTDRTRPTPAIGEVQALEERALDTWVWLGPGRGAEAPERPLLLLLHGMDGHPEKLGAFASALAREGVVVAAPVFPVSNRDAGGGAGAIVDVNEQVRDVGFVVDRLLEDVRDEDSELWARFDPLRLVGLGHSMGGATLLGRTRFGGGDPRFVAQAYAAAAMQLEPLLGDALERPGPPTLVMQGTEDDLVPPPFGEALFEAIDPPKAYLGIAGADHSEALESQVVPPIPAQEAMLAAVLGLVDEVARGEAGALDQALDALAAEGHEVR